MFCKIRNFLVIMLSCAFAFAAAGVKAQGLVSLSEEAMFDDGLESSPELPSLEIPAKSDVPAKTEVAPAQEAKPVEAKADIKELPAVKAPEAPKVESPKTDIFSLPPSDKGGVGLFGSNDQDASFSNDLFSQMSDLEKRTALLNLELRREKLQNEIEAVKNQRRQALQQEQEKLEAQKQKKIEFEKEQERKVIVEQEKLRELDIKFETLRQEKLLTAYKIKMLEENQKWIEHDANFYRQIAELRKSKKDLTEATKAKLEGVQKAALKAKETYLAKIAGYKNEIRDMQAQLGVLRSRIETMEREKEEERRNPFAGAEETLTPAAPASQQASEGLTVSDNSNIGDEPVETDLSRLYAVTEIRGQGSELIAKLINKNGTAFYVKKGTVLQSGHTISDITSTYVGADRNGNKSFLYFAAGGILPTETAKFEVEGGSAGESSTPSAGGPVAGRL